VEHIGNQPALMVIERLAGGDETLELITFYGLENVNTCLIMASHHFFSL